MQYYQLWDTSQNSDKRLKFWQSYIYNIKSENDDILSHKNEIKPT